MLRFALSFRPLTSLLVFVGLALVSYGVIAPKVAVAEPAHYETREPVKAYLTALSQETQIPYAWLKEAVEAAQYCRLCEKRMTPRKRPATADKSQQAKPRPLNFLHYSRRLLGADRMERGLAFLETHQATFQKAYDETGVSPWVIASIIGIETHYGHQMGNFRVLDVLMTLSFDYTRRETFYKKELGHFLRYCYREGIDPTSVRGSWAGAWGYGQFMPSSVDAYAKDGNGDGHADLTGSPEDAIMSVANYLAKNGWEKGTPIMLRAQGTDEVLRPFVKKTIKPQVPLKALRDAGVKVMSEAPDTLNVLVADIYWKKDTKLHGTYWYLGTQNFSTILSYNRAYYYATAVTLLAERFEAAFATRGETLFKEPTP